MAQSPNTDEEAKGRPNTMQRHVADMELDQPDRYEQLMRWVRYRSMNDVQRLMVSWGYKGYEGKAGLERVQRWWNQNFPTEKEIKELNSRMFVAAGVLPATQQEWQLYNTCKYLEKIFERLLETDRPVSQLELNSVSSILKEARSLSDSMMQRTAIEDAKDIALETVEVVYLELMETFKDTPMQSPIVECFRGIRKRVEARWKRAK